MTKEDGWGWTAKGKVEMAKYGDGEDYPQISQITQMLRIPPA